MTSLDEGSGTNLRVLVGEVHSGTQGSMEGKMLEDRRVAGGNLLQWSVSTVCGQVPQGIPERKSVSCNDTLSLFSC